MRLKSFQAIQYKSFHDSGKIELGNITILLGRNNSGKSALIRALHLLQEGGPMQVRDIRKGEREAHIHYEFDDFSVDKYSQGHNYGPTALPAMGNLLLKLKGDGSIELSATAPPPNNSTYSISRVKNQEPDNVFYLFLAKRRVVDYDQQVDRARTIAVSNDLRHLHSKVMRLTNSTNPASEEYKKLCIAILGFEITAHASPGGIQAGIQVGKTDYIPIEDMGEGVPSLLGLITDLCIAESQIFLIEELENDIHPQGLKALLEVILEKSKSNQFIISTHSNIVTKWLGTADNSKIYNIRLEQENAGVPQSYIEPLGTSIEERSNALQALGYELFDYDLWDGWMILEESSAERIIRDYLIPIFAPRLSRMRLLAAGGTSKVEPVFEDYRRLFLYSHLEPKYFNKAWVVVDGEPSGHAVVDGLQNTYKSWNSNNFRAFLKPDFEGYYPSQFAEKAATTVAIKDQKKKRKAKKALLDEVVEWCDSTPRDEVKAAFEASASEVIELLLEVEKSLFSQGLS